jgi:Tat protein translocase TatB subunit
MLSASEMIIVGVLALILIGPKQLPEVARTVGRLLSDLKRTANGFTSDFKSEMNREMAKHETPHTDVAPHTPAPTPANDPHKFILRYEDGTPMRPEDRQAEEVSQQIPPVTEKKDEPS